MRNRFKIASIHVGFSSLLIFFSYIIIFKVWYPQPLNIAMGIEKIYFLFLVVNLIICPILTFLVSKRGKSKVKLGFDVIVIVVLQLFFYLFCMSTLEKTRPAWLVFVVDDIELISPIDVDINKESKSDFKSSFFKKPQWVVAAYSNNPIERQKQKEDEMFYGINISTKIETFQKIENQKFALLFKLHPISNLNNFNKDVDILNDIVKKYPATAGWLPVKSPKQDMVALFNKDGVPIEVVNFRPWE